MKLASLKSGRDGRLVVVADDLAAAIVAGDIAPTLQAALEDWAVAAPKLQSLSDRLNNGTEAPIPLVIADCAAPLPRAYQWADGSVYLNHMRLVREARGAEMPSSFLNDPLMYQGGSDTMLVPVDDIEMAEEMGVSGVGVNFKNLRLKTVEQALKAKLDIRAWNPDTLREQQAMIALGVSGVGTNRPDILMEYLKLQ